MKCTRVVEYIVQAFDSGVKVVGDTFDDKLKEAHVAADGAREDFEKVNPPLEYLLCDMGAKLLLKTAYGLFVLGLRLENPWCNR